MSFFQSPSLGFTSGAGLELSVPIDPRPEIELSIPISLAVPIDPSSDTSWSMPIWLVFAAAASDSIEISPSSMTPLWQYEFTLFKKELVVDSNPILGTVELPLDELEYSTRLVAPLLFLFWVLALCVELPGTRLESKVEHLGLLAIGLGRFLLSMVRFLKKARRFVCANFSQALQTLIL